MGQYETMKADEVTIGGQNNIREHELEDVAPLKKLKAGLEAAIAALWSKRAESVRREMKRHAKRKARKAGRKGRA